MRLGRVWRMSGFKRKYRHPNVTYIAAYSLIEGEPGDAYHYHAVAYVRSLPQIKRYLSKFLSSVDGQGRGEHNMPLPETKV